ncbi:chromosome segregation protein Spc25-domain-containing protein [Peziza echinospora]|nr:chromosome segregation protein Spc25-domain-containing protein [Peziza echinospora]
MPPVANLPPPLPVINLGFDELRERMNRFTIRFDEFIEKGRRRLLVEKNEFARNVTEDKDSMRAMRAKIEHYKERERELQEQSARELEETTETERTILEMSRKRQQKLDYRDSLQAQLSTLEHAITTKRALRSRERASLAALSSHNLPELTFWEDHLCMRIEGAGAADHLRIVYTHILDSDWEREASFVVNMTTREYRVEQVRPRMAGKGGEEGVERATRRLNESRNFAAFLKEMRMGFVEAAEAGVWR